MLTRVDIEDCYLNARAMVSEWQPDFQAAWLKEDAEQELLAVWSTMPPEQRRLLKQADPGSYREAEKVVRKLEVRYGIHPDSVPK